MTHPVVKETLCSDWLMHDNVTVTLKTEQYGICIVTEHDGGRTQLLFLCKERLCYSVT